MTIDVNTGQPLPPASTFPTAPAPMPTTQQPHSPLNDILARIFSRMGGKNGAPRPMPTNNTGQTPGYAQVGQPERSALLQAMLERSRGGQPGGMPTAPIPVSGSTVPTAY